jgi:hypothetical protein
MTDRVLFWLLQQADFIELVIWAEDFISIVDPLSNIKRGISGLKSSHESGQGQEQWKKSQRKRKAVSRAKSTARGQTSPLRSRNQVIDSWLLDGDEEADEDIFADLEDFLVDEEDGDIL